MADSGMRHAIVQLLLEAGDACLSGQQISSRLGISRAAVWKHIEALRHDGFDICAQTARGYRLRHCPDRLLPAAIEAGLTTAFVGRRIDYHACIDSTNERASQLARAGAEEGLVVLAEEQSAGRGRLGRSWRSPAGVNLYASLVLRPQVPLNQAAQLTFLSAVAVARAVEQISGLQVQLKWPNDVLLQGRKLAGLLNELSAETEGIHHLIVGIGVNLNMTADQFPADLRYPATSLLLATGRPVDRVHFAQLLFQELEQLYLLLQRSGFTPLRLAWEALSDLTGRSVQVDCGSEILYGTVAGLAEDGALLLRTATGDVHPLYAGDVRPWPPVALNH